MSEIDSLNSLNFAGVQNSTNPALRNKKAEKASETKKSKFSDLLKGTKKDEGGFSVIGLPPEIETMSVEDAAIFLKDAVDTAGNALSEDLSEENLAQFKKTVKQFILFVEKNNFEVEVKVPVNRRTKRPIVTSPSPFFSSYSLPPQTKKKTSITVLNQKLDELTQETLMMQANNFAMLEKINDIKGLIVDLMSS